MKELLLMLAAVAIVTASAVAVAWPLARVACHAKWEDSRFPVRYSFLGGCQIQTKLGWIPAKALIRED